MNTQTQEYEKLKQEGISKILENGNGSWYDLVNDGFDLAEKLRQATQPIAADAEELFTQYLSKMINDYQVMRDGWKEGSTNFECYDLMVRELRKVSDQYLKHHIYASQPKGAGVKIKDFDINDKSHLVGICQWITQQDEYKSIPVTDVSSIFYHTSPLTFAKLIYKYWLDSSLPSQEGQQTK